VNRHSADGFYRTSGGSNMSDISILFQRPEDAADVDRAQEPDFFGDLNFDQIVASVTDGRD
jgi:hypothetical protein